MASRDRYVRILVGYAERFIEAGVPLPAIGLLLVLFTFTAKRTIQGCARVGVAGLAEALGLPVGALEKLLRALEQAGAIEFDRKARLLYVVGAVKASGPQTVQSVIAHHRDFSELPECGPKRTIERELLEVLAESDPKLMAEWEAQVKACTKSQPETYSKPSLTPIPIPDSEIRVPEPQPQPDTGDMTPYLEAFERLGTPFDYAAAAARLSEPQKEKLLRIALHDDLGPALQGLATSFLAGDRAKVRPTVLDIIVKAQLRQELREGKHEEVGRTWCCALCRTAHPIVQDCPPECRGCGQHHSPEFYCSRLKSLEASERQLSEENERQAEYQARLEQDACAEGISTEELQARREAEHKQQGRDMLRAAAGRRG